MQPCVSTTTFVVGSESCLSVSFPSLILILSTRKYKYKDHRTWAVMVHRCEVAWAEQMPALVEAYLLHKHGSTTIQENEEKFAIDVVGLDGKPPFSRLVSCSILNTTQCLKRISLTTISPAASTSMSPSYSMDSSRPTLSSRQSPSPYQPWKYFVDCAYGVCT